MIFLFWIHNLCHAQEDVSEERAKELFFNGQLLYEEGEYESAVLAWERGYELTHLPAFLKNIALAHDCPVLRNLVLPDVIIEACLPTSDPMLSNQLQLSAVWRWL